MRCVRSYVPALLGRFRMVDEECGDALGPKHVAQHGVRVAMGKRQVREGVEAAAASAATDAFREL